MGKSGPKPKPFECQENLFWYLAGLIATDGCLIQNRKLAVVTSKDEEYLLELRDQLGLKHKLRRKVSGFGSSIGYDLVVKRVALYDRLTSIGLTPRKSLTIGPLRVPDDFFRDFLRGVIDGDGSIRQWMHPSNGRQQWSFRIYSASKPFLLWIGQTAERLWETNGILHMERPRLANRRAMYILKYGKLAAKHILTQCYYPGVFALERKRRLAEDCISTPVGWAKSKTVVDADGWRKWTYVHTYRTKTVSKMLDTSSAFVEMVGFHGDS